LDDNSTGAFFEKPKAFLHSCNIHNQPLRQVLLLFLLFGEISPQQFLFSLKEGALLLVLGCLLPGALMTFHNGKLQPTKSLNLTFKTYVVRAHVLLPVRTLA